jgi:ubiquinone/menaquinone biosynthesis C-methylase UbiE
MTSVEFSFKRFAEQPFYKAVNVHLVEKVRLCPGQKVVELACGTGAVTRLIAEKLQGARESLVIAVDRSETALREALQQLSAFKEVAVQFIQSGIEQLSDVIKERVDAVVFCNGIHYIQDKGAVVQEVANTLKGGGTFAFNTAFFQGAQPPGTEQFYRRWMYKAHRWLLSHHGIRPTPEKIEARKQLTPEQYHQLLEQHCFHVSCEDIKAAPVTLQGWLDISSYEDFIHGAMPGVPLAEASEALRVAVAETFREMGLESVPRNWLTMVAVKSSEQNNT